jgi:iron complex outermembrane receptor protein
MFAARASVIDRLRILACLACSSLALATAADAQIVSTPEARYAETVVVTANAEPVHFDALTRDVALITADEIARLPITSVADLLRYVGGVDVRSRGPFGAQADFSLRGGNFGQVAVLVNGVRINDAQTGHHNGDIPVVLSAIERIEIVRGPGSSLHGADALVGAINIITRRNATGAVLRVSGGSDGLLAGDVFVAGSRGVLHESLAVSGLRTSGFMFDRDVANLAASSQTSVGDRTVLLVSHVRKAFGANGFYGPAPSKEWTDQTLVSIERSLATGPRWSASAVGSYRTHGDRFLWDVRQPAGFEARHRTQAITALVKVGRAISAGTRVTAGGEIGADWIRSSSLGNDGLVRGSLFAEVQQRVGARVRLDPGVRVDAYSTFGSTVNPSLGAAVALAPTVKLRSSLGRAFRIPTYTERYYRDPIHEANPALRPERAWSGEIGLDWLAGSTWLLDLTTFRRWERDGIDWVRATPQESWRTANIRHVVTGGLELGAQRQIASAGTIRVDYTYLNVEPGPLDVLSLYTLDYARHLVALSATIPLPAGFACAHRIGFGQRVDAQSYWLWDARLDRAFKRFTLSLEGSNLLDAHYQEVRGVEMPGRAVRASIRVLR